ncbi:molybdopterin biosynthesis protein [Oceanidesulfovibrio marinus]|uniref:Molybdopterin molybdenumtransferase n=1 Tax=Oceanidesulfovibrio marinus TaxID=370038 RepID=A0ABX6NH19_9BACT|nr:molybdopterin biosynthesis protein [Oceanidesulfovibrio marinus]QJT09931.1 molybdopterin biosynthesis protein [Oceanidesulfovibrio marinus]
MAARDRAGIYLETIPVEEAVAKVAAALDKEALLKSETIDSRHAAGRVTAAPVTAVLSSPNVHCAAMDGIAVVARSTFSAREGRPLTLVKGQDFVPVNTGHALPREPLRTDAVIMVEHVRFDDEGNAHIETPAYPWQHVRRMGEDIIATDMLLPHNHRITPYDVGALLAAGVWEVEVWERPSVYIVPTGDEVLEAASRPRPGPGQVVESNSYVLSALAEQAGCAVRRAVPVKDDPEAIRAEAAKGLEQGSHAVIICAGSSAGTKDYTRSVFDSLGTVLVHGVSAMPGKPALLGVADEKSPRPGALLAGAPGYPVSAAVVMEEIILPLLMDIGRMERTIRPEVPVTLARRSPSKPGLVEYLRLSVGRVGGRYVGMPLSRGAGNITSLSKAQAVTRIPMDSEGVEAGELVTAELLVTRSMLDRILLVIGSHDATLDLLADALMGGEAGVRLASSHVGSLGGLQALKAGNAHLAGCHLLDPESGDFNFPFLARYAPELECTVYNLAIRHQGLMVAPGNPLGIQGVNDLARDDVRFVNRQRGAGTRILLDYELAKANIEAATVNGYGKEEVTHTAVALNVATGEADCGLGIMAAAKALGLDFVPLARERYDLIIPELDLSDLRVQALLEMITKPEIKAAIEAQGGYETSLTGQRMRPGMGLKLG